MRRERWYILCCRSTMVGPPFWTQSHIIPRNLPLALGDRSNLDNPPLPPALPPTFWEQNDENADPSTPPPPAIPFWDLFEPDPVADTLPIEDIIPTLWAEWPIVPITDYSDTDSPILIPDSLAEPINIPDSPASPDPSEGDGFSHSPILIPLSPIPSDNMFLPFNSHPLPR